MLSIERCESVQILEILKNVVKRIFSCKKRLRYSRERFRQKLQNFAKSCHVLPTLLMSQGEAYRRQQFGVVRDYMLHPAQNAKLSIDVMAFILISSDILWMPLAIGWPALSPPWSWNLFCFGFWILEFLCKLRTAYYDSGGRSKWGVRVIRCNSLFRTF